MTAVGTVSTAVWVVLLVVGILAILVAVLIAIILWPRNRNRRVAEQLQAEIEGGSVLRPPEKGS